MNILALGAHPDDVEVQCTGTLTKFVKKGHKIYASTLSNGDKGSLKISPEKLGKIRVEEARKASEIVGAQYKWLGFRDCEIYLESKSVQKVIERIQEVKADIIFTHDPNDYHPDHMATSEIVTYAIFGAGVPHLESKFSAHIPKRLYYCDTVFGVNFTPDFWVDISSTFDLKLKALSEHKTQIEWVKKHHEIDLLEDIRTHHRFRGLQAGVKYAEAFRYCRKHMHMGAVDLPPI